MASRRGRRAQPAAKLIHVSEGSALEISDSRSTTDTPMRRRIEQREADPKPRASQQTSFFLVVMEEKFVVKMYRDDGSFKTLQLHVDSKADEVFWEMCKRLNIHEAVAPEYDIYEFNVATKEERVVQQFERIMDVLSRWTEENRLIFKRQTPEGSNDPRRQSVTLNSETTQEHRNAKLSNMLGENVTVNVVVRERVIRAPIGASPTTTSPTDPKLAPDPALPLRKRFNLDDFDFLKILGKGAYGKVYLCQRKNNQLVGKSKLCAIKVVQKSQLMNQILLQKHETENWIMRSIEHPFIIRMLGAFQTPLFLFHVMEFAAGGDLYMHTTKCGKFPEERARFYSAELFLALNFLHTQKIIYRDLKLENVLIDASGHIKLTDFGLSSWEHDEEDHDHDSIAGTMAYLSPELLMGHRHTFASDWWAYGVLLFEMLCGFHPFMGNDPRHLAENIVSKKITIPSHVSADARQLLAGLMVRNPAHRFGTENEEEIQQQSFFQDLDFAALTLRQIDPPFMPELKGEQDLQYFDIVFIQEACERDPRWTEDTEGPSTFKEFSFVR